MFILINQPLIKLFYIKKYLFFAELAMIQRWFAIFCVTGVWEQSFQTGTLEACKVSFRTH